MKLFALPDGTIDEKERAQWVTPPFDLATVEQNVGGRRVLGKRSAQAQNSQNPDAQPRIIQNGNASIRRD